MKRIGVIHAPGTCKTCDEARSWVRRCEILYRIPGASSGGAGIMTLAEVKDMTEHDAQRTEDLEKKLQALRERASVLAAASRDPYIDALPNTLNGLRMALGSLEREIVGVLRQLGRAK